MKEVKHMIVVVQMLFGDEFIIMVEQLDVHLFIWKQNLLQFWPPVDEHMCSKHVEAWNKLTVKHKFCASSWLITEIKNDISSSRIYR